MSNHKQQKILAAALSKGGEITKKEAIEVQGVNSYYSNASKHVGDILSRMVNSGILIRISPGKFKVNKDYKKNKVAANQTQTDLFKQ